MFEKITSRGLHHSSWYEIKDLRWDFSQDSSPLSGYNDCFCLMLVKQGALRFDIANNTLNMHSGHILIDKPNYEYRMSASSGQCTVLNFSDEFYAGLIEEMHLGWNTFFANRNRLTFLQQSTPVMEYLHHQLLQHPYLSQIEMDGLMFELLMHTLKRTATREPELISKAPKKFHLPIIERAKEYIHQYFQHDFSLMELSNFTYTSPFHFSRIFKHYTACSPHQYVLQVRLKHSEMLLKNTAKSVADIAFESGFNNPDYFATAFKREYGLSPSAYKETGRAPLCRGV